MNTFVCEYKLLHFKMSSYNDNRSFKLGEMESKDLQIDI